jgi:predicted nucleotidyltransferase
LAARAAEVLEGLALVPGVVGLVLGGSYGRGRAWPLSDLDVIVISADRPVAEVAAEIDRSAYQLSEMWGVSGIYTAVDAGRLTFDLAEVHEPGDVVERMADDRWLHGLDKSYGGRPWPDDHGAAAALLALAEQWRFDPAVVDRRIRSWLEIARRLLDQADQLLDQDRIGTWIAIRRAAGALAEVATERWGERAGSLGRYWTLFEDRAGRHGGTEFADELMTAACAHRGPTADVPEWLADRIALSYRARLLVGEQVTAEQNVRDNLIAFAGLYRGRFPRSADPWMAPPPEVDARSAIGRLRELWFTASISSP